MRCRRLELLEDMLKEFAGDHALTTPTADAVNQITRSARNQRLRRKCTKESPCDHCRDAVLSPSERQRAWREKKRLANTRVAGGSLSRDGRSAKSPHYYSPS